MSRKEDKIFGGEALKKNGEVRVFWESFMRILKSFSIIIFEKSDTEPEAKVFEK